MFGQILAKKGRTLTCLLVHQLRSTWVLRRVLIPEPTTEGQFQRDPEELPNMMKYEVVENENETSPGLLKVILLDDVEGIGNQFEVVEVNREQARNELILGRRAVYASPFDLKYYGELREKMKEELNKKVRIPYQYILVARELVKKIIPIHVSLTNPWILNRMIVLCSLIEEGIYAGEEAIFLTKEELKGPDMALEARLMRFYLVIGKQYVVPMIGRISHITSDSSKQVLYPEKPVLPTEKELQENGIPTEDPYFHKSSNINVSFDVSELMERRRKGMG